MSSNEEEFYVSTADLADVEIYTGYFAMEQQLKVLLEQLQALNDQLDELRECFDEWGDEL